MSHKPPTPPEDLPDEMVDTLDSYSPTRLRYVAHYAEALASHKAPDTLPEEESDDDGGDERPDDLPGDVPAKATITIKEINGNRYYYWQWRDGETVRSQYKGPVDSNE